VTFLELQTEVFRRLEEDSSSPDFHTLQKIKDSINEGYEEISEATEWYETNLNISLTTSTYYDLSSLTTRPFLSLSRVFNNQINQWLVTTDYRELDNQFPMWEANTGEPTKILMRGAWWLGLYPKAPAASGTIKLYHTGMPAALSADGDTPGFPQEFHPALLDYATYDRLCHDRQFDKAMQYWQAYQQGEQKLAEYVRSRIRMDRVPMMGGRP